MRVLVLVDGIETRRLLEQVTGLFGREGTLVLVHVRGPARRAGLELVRQRPGHHGPLPPHLQDAVTAAEQERGASALEEAAGMARGLGRHVETRELAGEPGRAVCEAALSERVDVVALRAGAGPLGPVAAHVTAHAPCPVLLLRGG